MDGADDGRIVVLDGGLATELEARGHDLSDRLWSARLLLTDPGAIEDVHLDYFRAGATVATTASYQATLPGLRGGRARPGGRARRHPRQRHARPARPRPVRGGGRPRGRHEPPRRRVRRAVRRDAGRRLRVPRRLRSGRDGAPRGPRAADRGAARRRRRPARVRDDPDRPRGGGAGRAARRVRGAGLAELFVPRRIVDVGRRADRGCDRAGRPSAGRRRRHQLHPAPLAAGAAGGRAIGHGKPLIAYPNRGDRWDPAARRWLADDEGGRFDAGTVASWTDLGASWLGGCCGTGPADIAALADHLERPPAARVS